MIGYHRPGGRIRIGLPKGNLNREESNRGCTSLLLEKAGFKMVGYNPRAEKDMPTAEGEPDIEFYCMKPKQMPVLLEENELDLAILGEDTLEERYSAMWQDKFGSWLEGNTDDSSELWDAEEPEKELERDSPNIKHYKAVVREDRIWNPDKKKERWAKLKGRIKEIYSGRANEKDRYQIEGSLPYELSDLGYGQVKICWGVHAGERVDKHGFKKSFDWTLKERGLEVALSWINPVKIASAYPNIAYGELCKLLFPRWTMHIANNSSFHWISPREKFGLKNFGIKDAPKFVIYPLASNTEMMVKLGLADVVMDSVSSGTSFKRNNLEIIDEPVSHSTVHLYTNDYLSGYLSDSYECLRKGLYSPEEVDEFMGVSLKRLDEIVQRLKEASHKYALERQDSIWYPDRRPAEAKQ